MTYKEYDSILRVYNPSLNNSTSDFFTKEELDELEIMKGW